MERTFFKAWLLVPLSKKFEVYSRKLYIDISFECIVYFVYTIIVSILLKLEVQPQAQQIKKSQVKYSEVAHIHMHVPWPL